jgi:hypothetical protein
MAGDIDTMDEAGTDLDPVRAWKATFLSQFSIYRRGNGSDVVRVPRVLLGGRTLW